MKLSPIIFGTGLLLAACQANPEPLGEVVVMLDWVPNTNHSGLFVAQELGYFDEVGLQVQIIQPGEVFAEQAVVGGAADFGVSFQEQVTLARADGLPLVSIAAILQHNSSGFAARGELDAARPADWESLRYGSFGSPFEQPTLRVLMECDQANFDQLEIVETGFADPLALLDAGQIDLAWFFRGWQGIQAEQQNIDLDLVMMEDWFECIPDYYTPILIASESTLSSRPAVVRAFLAAVSRGYSFAIQDPEEAAAILLQVAPELEPALVQASQAWLSPRYQAEAPRWGEQRLEVWQAYSTWMAEHGILTAPIDAAAAFTNAFLP
jgi:ABC-type nitrate/sulfonate/bicarbonate transport system substrate-binding protein